MKRNHSKHLAWDALDDDDCRAFANSLARVERGDKLKDIIAEIREYKRSKLKVTTNG